MSQETNRPSEKSPARPKVRASLREAVGSLCELRSMDNSLIFLGRLQDYDGDAVLITGDGAGEVPPVVYNTPFKVVVHAHGQPVRTWRGAVCGSAPGFWKLDRLRPAHASELRAHFRQVSMVHANALCVNALYPSHRSLPRARPHPAIIMDISLGGLQLRSRETFESGDWLLLTDVDLSPQPSPRPFVLTCQVRWAEQARNGSICGCLFAPMDPAEQDRLCAAIFELQRLDIQLHREG